VIDEPRNRNSKRRRAYRRVDDLGMRLPDLKEGTFLLSVGHSPERVEFSNPDSYRLAKDPSGNLTLQGRFVWRQGSASGIDWRDIPTVDKFDVGLEAHTSRVPPDEEQAMNKLLMSSQP
jgi:hypothetical protein